MLTKHTATVGDIWPRDQGGCPHPRPVRDEIIRVAREEITAADLEDARIRGVPLTGWYLPFYLAEERVMARQQLGKTLQDQEIQDLRQRVRALEAWFAPDKEGAPHVIGHLIDVIAEALGRTTKKLRKELGGRINKLEQGQLRFLGVHEAGRAYRANSVVVKRGGLWVALTDTVTPPGSSNDWKLAVKSGSIAMERGVE